MFIESRRGAICRSDTSGTYLDITSSRRRHCTPKERVFVEEREL
jgi:hypothetical protein